MDRTSSTIDTSAEIRARTTIADPGRLATIAGLTACVAMVLAILAPAIASRPLMGDDLGSFHWPIRTFFARCLAEGDDPLWHPGILCGSYVHGEGQAGMDHPLHRALYGWLPLKIAFAIEVAIGYPGVLVGMVLWLRRVGLRSEAAILGGVVFAFSGFLLLRYVHTNAVQVIAHLPWILLGVEAMAGRTAPGRLVAPALIALATASQGLLGYPQYLGFSLLISGSYALARLRIRGLVVLAVAVALGLVAASAQILPQLDALATSTRSRPTTGFLGEHSLHPLDLAQIVSPMAFRTGHYDPETRSAWPRHESVAYLGAVVPALLAWLWIRRRDLGKARAVARWAAILGATAIVLSLGGYSPLFRIYAKLPGAGVFRAPSRYIVIAQLAAAVLAAIAFGDLAKVASTGVAIPRRTLRPLLWPVVASLAVGLGLGLAVLRPSGWQPGRIAAPGDLARSVFVIAVPCLLVAMSARGRRLAPALLVLFAAVDSSLYALRPIARHEVSTHREEHVPPDRSGRVVAPGNWSLAEGARLVGGYVALSPRRRLDYTTDAALRRAGAVWQLDEQGLWTRLGLDPLPRARLVSEARSSRDHGSEIAEIDSATTALVDSPVDLDPGEAGSAAIVEDGPGRITVNTESPGRRLLVVSESHHHGWVVLVDGRAVPTIRVDGDFLGLVVARGRHTVSFRFSPRSTRVGRVVSLCGLAIILATLITGFALERPSSRPCPMVDMDARIDRGRGPCA